MNTRILFCLFSLCAIVGFGQVEFGEPRKMPKEINSPAEEDFPIVSSDGTILIFNRTFYPGNVGGLFAGQDIWMTHLQEDSTWAPAENEFPSASTEPLNDEYNNVVIGLTPNSDTVFLLNKYHHHKRRYKHHHHHQPTHSGISFSYLQDGKWSAPVDFEVPHLRDHQPHYTAYMDPSADVLIMSMFGPKSVGEEDLFVALRGDTSWTEPFHMGDVINSVGYEISPFLDRDGKTLYFASNKEGGLGNCDIYKTTRLDDTWKNWSEPVNLGEPINSTGFDAYLYLTDDNAFFTRNLDTLTSDLFIAPITRLDDVDTTSSAADSLLALDEFPGDSLVDLNPVVNMDTSVLLNILVEEEAFMAKGANKDSLVHEGAVAFKDEYNTNKGYQVVDLHDEEVRDKSEDQLKELKLAPHSVDIHFNYNLSSLDEDDEKVLEKVVYLLKNDPELTAILVGHTCDVGSHSFNDRLSKQRAYTASAYLKAQGIKDDRMSVKWLGETKPVAPNDTENGKAQNRRVEIDFDRMD